VPAEPQDLSTAGRESPEIGRPGPSQPNGLLPMGTVGAYSPDPAWGYDRRRDRVPDASSED